MDPQATLTLFLDTLRDYHNIDAVPNGPNDPDGAAKLTAKQHCQEQAIEAIQNLARWLALGGFLPQDPYIELSRQLGVMSGLHFKVQQQLQHLQRKVAHGCTDAHCADCDGAQ